jgi:SAM-dependent methyltransferase
VKLDFYRAFEERHRGSRESVKERLRAYLPFLQPLAERQPGAPAIDLGCGRGEWLELLRDLGFRSHGVDLDDAMLQGCRDAGLSAERGDALVLLAALPDASQAIVSAFHLVEHLEFGQVQALVREALRVLRPGGLLVLETPNPENIVVATSNFYLDPTHRHPLPPQLLSFLPEYHGFPRVKTVRLQEPAGLHAADASLTLYDVLGSASPDYAVVAQKGGDDDLAAALAMAFQADYGVTMVDLAQKYQGQLQAALDRLAGQVAAQAALQQEWQKQLQEAAARAAAAENMVHELSAQVAAMRGRPLFVGRITSFIEANPELRLRIVAVAQRLHVHGLLRRVFRAMSARTAQSAGDAAGMAAGTEPMPPLTPRARAIEEQLQQQVRNRRKGS